MLRTAEALNQTCRCITVDEAALRLELARIPELTSVVANPNFFALVPLFLPRTTVDHIERSVRVLESVIRHPGFQKAALADAPAIAKQPTAARGVLFGYDFHLGANGPQLIEINTNAGGALLNTALARAQRRCCPEVEPFIDTGAGLGTEKEIVASFVAEWRAERQAEPLRRIAIVDDAPKTQFLYPEFLLFQSLFHRAGIEAIITDPRDLSFVEGELMSGAGPIDLVYNRSTDFYFVTEASRPLAEAYAAQAVVVTPSPFAHALYANKKNLVTLSDPERLMALGVSAADAREVSSIVPFTRRVNENDGESLWANRKQYFFKPVAGFGGKAAYRGDKLTKTVFAEILRGDYVAQQVVQPSQRMVSLGGEMLALKVDVRAYAYDGKVQLLAARLYQGQTTNFRTAGGGFASVMTTSA